MKSKTLITTLILFALAATTAFAKTWEVDSGGGVTADFTRLQEAHDGAAVGDTLFVMGSPVNYANITLTKTLYIFGPGYFLFENQARADVLPATTGTISFQAGSEGSLFTGLYVDGAATVTIGTDNITFRKNRIAYRLSVIFGVSNTLIMQNYFDHTYISPQTPVTIAGNCNNIEILNNFINGQPASQSINSLSTSSVTLSHNVLKGTVVVYNSQVDHNILIEGDFEEDPSNSVFNNIGSSTQFGTENGNLSDVDMSAVFVGIDSHDTQWQLSDNSPALGAGTDGKDIGMFAGYTPYVLSGIPQIPAIYYFDASPIGTSEGLRIRMKARAGGN